MADAKATTGGSDTFYLEQVTLDESDDDFEYEEVDVEEDEEDDGDEDFDSAMQALKAQEARSAGLPASPQRAPQAGAGRRAETIDDFIRNFLVKMKLGRTLDAFQTEWFELAHKGQLSQDDVGAVPDIYLRNQQLDDQLKTIMSDMIEAKEVVRARTRWLPRAARPVGAAAAAAAATAHCRAARTATPAATALPPLRCGAPCHSHCVLLSRSLARPPARPPVRPPGLRFLLRSTRCIQNRS